MKKIAVYPGSFDPITNGHIDLIKRACEVFDWVIVGITQNNKKNAFLNIEQRVSTIKKAMPTLKNLQILAFEGLLVDFAQAQNARIILRGIRAVSDFDYEFQLAGMNKQLAPNIETIFMTPNEKYANISSSLVKEIYALGGSIKSFVPKSVIQQLQQTL
jgi:pantetheine-phosphate adenylyltransferase